MPRRPPAPPSPAPIRQRRPRSPAAIAAASILAKTVRDAGMVELHQQYPQYGFDRHMGYPTAAHFAALQAQGPCPAHRRSFAPVAAQLSLL